jgi:hypothetical protein
VSTHGRLRRALAGIHSLVYEEREVLEEVRVVELRSSGGGDGETGLCREDLQRTTVSAHALVLGHTDTHSHADGVSSSGRLADLGKRLDDVDEGRVVDNSREIGELDHQRTLNGGVGPSELLEEHRHRDGVDLRSKGQ